MNSYFYLFLTLFFCLQICWTTPGIGVLQKDVPRLRSFLVASPATQSSKCVDFRWPWLPCWVVWLCLQYPKSKMDLSFLNIYNIRLVGGLEHFFSHILGIIISIDFHIFQRGGPTTNQTYNFWTSTTSGYPNEIPTEPVFLLQLQAPKWRQVSLQSQRLTRGHRGSLQPLAANQGLWEVKLMLFRQEWWQMMTNGDIGTIYWDSTTNLTG